MQGYQFGHVETWSRAGVATQNGETQTHRRNGQRGWSPDEVIAEAERRHDASEHVVWSGLRPLVFPGTCASFEELRRAHDQATAVKLPFPYVCKKTGKNSVRKRKVRVDAHTLYTSIISLPMTSAEALQDKAKMQECLRALRIAKSFEKRRLEAAGGEFAMAVVHLDERHVHMHIYGLDRQRGSVNRLHPGKAAIEDFRAVHGALAAKGTNLFQRSKRVYCDAMRGWQNDLHREASVKVGLTRFGPKRGRLSRSAWVRAQQDAEARAQVSIDLRADREKRNSLRRAADLMEQREGNIVAVAAEQEAEKSRLSNWESELEEQSERLASQSVNVRRQAEVNAAERTRLANENRAIEVRRDEADKRIELAGDVEERALKVARGQRENEAAAAAIEAMVDGLVVVEVREAEVRIRKAKTAGDHAAWPRLRAAFQAAPQAALEMAARLADKIAALKTNAEKEVEAKLRARFDAVEAASSSIKAVQDFAENLIQRLPRSERHEQQSALLDAIKNAAVGLVKARRGPRSEATDTGEIGK